MNAEAIGSSAHGPNFPFTSLDFKDCQLRDAFRIAGLEGLRRKVARDR